MSQYFTKFHVKWDITPHYPHLYMHTAVQTDAEFIKCEAPMKTISPVDVRFLHHSFHSVVELKESHVLREKKYKSADYLQHYSSMNMCLKLKHILTFSSRGNRSSEFTPVK